MNLRKFLSRRVAEAFSLAGSGEVEPLLSPATRSEFGDYQANGAMAIAKDSGENPRKVASAVVDSLDLRKIATKVEVAGPGFINITLSPDFLSTRLGQNTIEKTTLPNKVVIDYSSPNLAKEMHVGHLRTTIGDAMARIFEALGHQVIRQNHVGDWGTQFGMLVAHLQDLQQTTDELKDLETFYTQARIRFDNDPEFADVARKAVVSLQAGDEDMLSQWRRFIDVSLSHCRTVYKMLGITLVDSDLDAESRYNEDLPRVVDDLEKAGLLTESEGAKCVFLDDFEMPVIVQKRDGGYLYATSDLAAVKYRCQQLNVDRILYFTDFRQVLHFKQFFAVAKAASFVPKHCTLEHHPFGTIMGKDKKPFKTRAGDVVKLADLLDEAVQRAFRLVKDKNPDLDDTEADYVARVVGIGAVKYADLSRHRSSDYVFDWNTMLSFEGNTAPYLQYAYARIQSLFRRGQVDPSTLSGSPHIEDPTERLLAVTLLRFQETIEQAATEALPHYLCGYLYNLASQFMKFYETCPVLNAPGTQRIERLKLCALTAQTLGDGLALLGIETVDRM